MILPFLRLRLDENGLFKNKPPAEHYKKSVTDLISWLKENLPDAEEMRETMSPEDLSIEPEEYRQYFNGYLSFYAFLIFTFEERSDSYHFNWREYATFEQRKWIESWHVFDDAGKINLLGTMKKLRNNLCHQNII